MQARVGSSPTFGISRRHRRRWWNGGKVQRWYENETARQTQSGVPFAFLPIRSTRGAAAPFATIGSPAQSLASRRKLARNEPTDAILAGSGGTSIASDTFKTERGGFEPPIGFDTYNGLANRRFRPLSHLSRTTTKTLETSCVPQPTFETYQTHKASVNSNISRRFPR